MMLRDAQRRLCCGQRAYFGIVQIVRLRGNSKRSGVSAEMKILSSARLSNSIECIYIYIHRFSICVCRNIPPPR